MPYKSKADKAAWQRENDGDAQRVIDYDKRHPEKARARRKRYRLLNAAKVRESQRKWRHANRAKIKARPDWDGSGSAQK